MVDKQRLIFAGKQLEDGRTLADYNIQKESQRSDMEKRKAERSDMKGARARKPLRFAAGDAVDPCTNFYQDTKDLDRLTQQLWASNCLLITGPPQSGKSTLMYRLAQRVHGKDSISVVVTLDEGLIEAANKSWLKKKETFFYQFGQSMERGSGNRLHHDHNGGSDWQAILDMLAVTEHRKEEVFFFIDQAEYLNNIKNPNVLLTLLNGLRSCKENSKCTPASHYRLRSLVLVGTAKTCRLVTGNNAGGQRNSITTTVTAFDSYYPLSDATDHLRLNIHIQMTMECFDAADIAELLQEYKKEHGVVFRASLEEDPEAVPVDQERQTAIIRKYASNIFSLTSGHKGMVGSCCMYLANKISEVSIFTEWKRQVRLGYVAAHLFRASSYSRMASSITGYSEELRQIIFRSVISGSSVPVTRDDVDKVLPAVNDGLLVKTDLGVNVSSGLLLQAILEDSHMAPRIPLAKLQSFHQALELAFSYMNVNRLKHVEADTQPAEYVWQLELLLSTKFVLENTFSSNNYSVLVEAKRKKNGRFRLEFVLKSSDLKGCRVQGAGDEESIKKHVIKSDEKHRVVYGCEMHYIYLQFGDAPANAARDPKSVIARESRGRELTCWFVCYIPAEHVWVVERLVGSQWLSSRMEAASEYPEFMFGSRGDTIYT